MPTTRNIRNILNRVNDDLLSKNVSVGKKYTIGQLRRDLIDELLRQVEYAAAQEALAKAVKRDARWPR